jgi:GT2 family glycosyltransferase
VKNLYRSLKKYIECDFELIVVDNNSMEQDKELLKELNINKNISIIFNNENIGFGRACNIGVESSSYETIILINPDVVLIETGLENLINNHLSNDVGILAPRILNEDLTIQPNGGGFTGLLFYILYSLKNIIPMNKVKNIFKHRIFKNSSYEEYIKNFDKNDDSFKSYDWVSGAFMIMKKEVFNKVGGFDRNFFMYTEDKDLCFQIKKKLKKKILVAPTYKIVHSIGGTQEKKNNIFMEVIKMKSRIYYMYKNNGILKAIALKYFYVLLVLFNNKFNKNNFSQILKYNYNNDSSTIVGYYGSGNIGDECILHSLLEEYDITNNIVLSNDVKYTESLHLVKSYPKKSITGILSSFLNTNRLIIGGGGLFLRENYTTYIYMYLIAKLFRLFGKKVYIDGIGLNYGALDKKINNYLFLKLIKNSEFIKVRDTFSYDLIIENYKNKKLDNLFLRNDFVFDYLDKWKKENNTLSKEHTLGVSLMNLNMDYSNIEKFIQKYIDAKYLIKFYLFFKNENDDVILNKLIERLEYSNIKTIEIKLEKNEDFNNLFLEMSKNECFLSMRFHPMLISYKLGSKVFVIPHNSKISNFATKYNLETIV